jgi:hypothetical protein
MHRIGEDARAPNVKGVGNAAADQQRLFSKEIGEYRKIRRNRGQVFATSREQ